MARLWYPNATAGKLLIESALTPFNLCRAHKEKECAASECSLLCNDYSRLGYRNMVVDPGVRQAYDLKDAKDLYNTEWV